MSSQLITEAFNLAIFVTWLDYRFSVNINFGASIIFVISIETRRNRKHTHYLQIIKPSTFTVNWLTVAEVGVCTIHCSVFIQVIRIFLHDNKKSER